MQDKVILITGGSYGIGETTACLFTQRSVKVAIGSHHAENGEKVVQTIREAGGQALWIRADVSQAAEVMDDEAHSCAHLGLPDKQQILLKAVHATSVPVAAAPWPICFSGTPTPAGN